MSVPSTSSIDCPCMSLVRTLGKVGAFVLPVAAAVLAVIVLAPWRSLDAAAPSAADDPFNKGNIVYPVPQALNQRGLHKSDSDDAVKLNNWNYTYNHEGF
jgi:hypothetical protein